VIERGILFSAPMVRALLDGSKTQTRRAVKLPKSPDHLGQWEPADIGGDGVFTEKGELAPPMRAIWHTRTGVTLTCPYGRPGDRLWVRETWADLEQITDGSFARQAIYRADDIDQYGNEDEYVDVTAPDMRWRPSIHMPRWASRILLEIVSVRVERLNAISDDDCWAEGIEACDGMLDDLAIIELAKRMGRTCHDAAPSYAALWESINGAGSWDANPWVWVIEFRRTEP